MGKFGFFAVLGLMITFIVYNLFHFGVFKSVEISESTRGPYFLIYKEHVGPYHETVDAIKEVETWAKAVGLACPDAFGEYLDNPDVVEQARLKSNGGCLMTAAPTVEIPKDLKSKTIPEQNYVIASFTGSPAIGPYKVYTKVARYIKERQLQPSNSIIEIYHMPEDQESMSTTYLFSLKK